MTENTFDGAEKAAILLMTLGEQHAAEVLRHLGPKAVQAIGTAMASLDGVARTDVRSVISEFMEELSEKTTLGVGNEEYLRNVLKNALGEDKASGLIDRILLGRNSKGLESLKWMDPRQVAEILRLEHPQIIAVVLSYLDQDHGAEIISLLPQNMRTDVLMRIAMLDGIMPGALTELDDILESQLTSDNASTLKSSNVGGLKTAAGILNLMDRSLESELLSGIGDSDAELAQKIQDLMFVFDDLAGLGGNEIQTLLREVDSQTLVTALKLADEGLKEKFFDNMPRRVAETMRDDLEMKGPVKVSEAEAAQKEILNTARRLADAGEISLSSSSDEYV